MRFFAQNRRPLAVAVVVLTLALGWMVRQLKHPSFSPYQSLVVDLPASKGLRITFLGVSTLLFEDEHSRILIDGFFSRPGMARSLFCSVEPNQDLVKRALERLGIETLDAIFVVHSHYDHLLDSPEVARQTGALVFGSESTARVALAYGINKARICVVVPGQELHFGKFRVTPLLSKHLPSKLAQGEIPVGVKLPLRANEYLEGGCYSLMVKYAEKCFLVQGSAGYLEGALDHVQADVVFLGIGGMGKQSSDYREAYWSQVVESTHPKVVVPIHWDDFSEPLDKPLEPLPLLFDNFDKSMEMVQRKSRQQKILLRFLTPWVKTDANRLLAE